MVDFTDMAPLSRIRMYTSSVTNFMLHFEQIGLLTIAKGVFYSFSGMIPTSLFTLFLGIFGEVLVDQWYSTKTAYS